MATGLLIACGDSAIESVSTAPIDPNAPARLALLSVGDGSVTIVLAPVPELGATWSGTIELSQRLTVDGRGATVPPMIMHMVNEVTETTDAGFVVKSELLDVELGEGGDLSEGDREALRAEVRGMIGLVTISHLDSYGVVVDADIVVPPGFPELPFSMDQMTDTVESMTTTVPRFPLSVGATWTDTTVDDSLGPETTAVTTYRLTDISGTTYTLEFDIEMTMAGEVVESGTTVRMDGTLTGSGTTIADTREAGPLSGSSLIGGVIEVSADGESLEMEMHTTMELRSSN